MRRVYFAIVFLAADDCIRSLHRSIHQTFRFPALRGAYVPSDEHNMPVRSGQVLQSSHLTGSSISSPRSNHSRPKEMDFCI